MTDSQSNHFRTADMVFHGNAPPLHALISDNDVFRFESSCIGFWACDQTHCGRALLINRQALMWAEFEYSLPGKRDPLTPFPDFSDEAQEDDHEQACLVMIAFTDGSQREFSVPPDSPSLAGVFIELDERAYIEEDVDGRSALLMLTDLEDSDWFFNPDYIAWVDADARLLEASCHARWREMGFE